MIEPILILEINGAAYHSLETRREKPTQSCSFSIFRLGVQHIIYIPVNVSVILLYMKSNSPTHVDMGSTANWVSMSWSGPLLVVGSDRFTMLYMYSQLLAYL